MYLTKLECYNDKILQYQFISFFNFTIGDFKDAEVYVYSNYLTQFKESVFGPMLQQMAYGKGFISASLENGSIIV